MDFTQNVTELRNKVGNSHSRESVPTCGLTGDVPPRPPEGTVRFGWSEAGAEPPGRWRLVRG